MSRYGRDLTSVFDLLGRHEPALTAALGWTLGQSPTLLAALLRHLGLNAEADVSLTLETADAHGRTDIEIVTSTAHVIIEAKHGWLVPGETQLTAYTRRLVTDRDRRLVTLSDSTARWAQEVLPADLAGVPVVHLSWDDVRDLVRTSRRLSRGTERVWLDQLEDYMGATTSKRQAADSLAYCVVVSNQVFGGVKFRDYVQTQRVYFHPFASSGWPVVAPNFLAFRWGNALRQVNRVTSVEIVGELSDRFTAVNVNESAGLPHVVYNLGPDIPLPGGSVPSGRNLRNTRLWILVDQLLVHPTVVEAHAASEVIRGL